MNINKIFYSFLVFSFCFFSSCFPYYLSVCAIFQDDAKYLPEWIEFHHKQGVEHFYLYNNLSTDDYKSYLNPYAEKGWVTLYDWPYSVDSKRGWIEIQCAAYMDCINRIRGQDFWCAFIDTDEFLFSPHKKLPKKLRDYESYSGVVVNWMVYGTSNVKKIPKEKRLVDYLVMRAHHNHEMNQSVKTIVRPSKVKGCMCPHFFLYHSGYAVNECEEKIPEWRNINISVKKFRINHYWTRDEEFFHTVKMERRRKWVGEVEEFIKIANTLNEVFDPILAM